MADEPERRPEPDDDSEAAEDDAERDEPDSSDSGPGDETAEDRSPAEDGHESGDATAESDDGEPEGSEADPSPDDADAADESDAAEGNLSKGAAKDSHGQRESGGVPASDASGGSSDSLRSSDEVEPPTPDEAAAAREADGLPTSDGRSEDDADGHLSEPPPTPDEVYGPKRPGRESTPPESDEPGVEGEAVGSDGGAVSVDRPDNMAETTPVERKTGPVSDQEMPLADHVEEMVTRLFVVIAIAGLVSVAVFPAGEEIIDFLWYSVLPGGDVAQPRVYHPLSLILTQLKVASLAGLIVALPVFVYQTYAFMRPGLYPHERRYYLASVPMSLVLALVGVTFAYFVVLPAIFTYFLYYSETVTTIAFALSDTFSLILLLMGYLALVFQIPLFIMLAIMMGLTTRRWLQDRRLYFWGGFLGVAFLFSPDPTGMAPIMVAATMIVLFEGTLLLLRWTGR